MFENNWFKRYRNYNFGKSRLRDKGRQERKYRFARFAKPIRNTPSAIISRVLSLLPNLLNLLSSDHESGHCHGKHLGWEESMRDYDLRSLEMFATYPLVVSLCHILTSPFHFCIRIFSIRLISI